MAMIYVARSAELAKWGEDVGLGKHLYKLGVADQDPALQVAGGLAQSTDWIVLKTQPISGLTEEDVIARLASTQKMIDPNYYPRLRGALGIFRLSATQVENHTMIARALAGQADMTIKLKPVDFADYMIRHALPPERTDEND